MAVGAGAVFVGAGVLVGRGVFVGGTGVLVGDTGVFVGVRVLVGSGVFVGGTGVLVAVGNGVGAGWTSIDPCPAVAGKACAGTSLSTTCRFSTFSVVDPSAASD